MLKWLLCVCIAVLPSWLFSQDSSDKITARFEHFSEEDGLIPGIIKSIAEDADGFMWLGGNNGICRFDGKRFDRVTRSVDDKRGEELVSKIVFGNSAWLYVGTQYGLWRYNIETGERQELPNQLADGRPRNQIHFLQCLRDGRIAIAYGSRPPEIGGLSIFDPETGLFSNFLVEENAGGRGICQDPIQDSIVWFGGQGGLFRVNIAAGTHRVIVQEEERTNGELYTQILYINDSTLWAPHWFGQLQTFHIPSETWTKLAAVRASRTSAIDGSKAWFGAMTDGTGYYDFETKETHFFKVEPNNDYALPRFESYCIVKDSRGLMWIGHAHGASVYNPFLQNVDVRHFKSPRNSQEDMRMSGVAGHKDQPLLVLGCVTPDGFFLVDSTTLELRGSVPTMTHNDHRQLKGKEIASSFGKFISPDTLVFTGGQGVMGLRISTRETWTILPSDGPKLGPRYRGLPSYTEDGRIICAGREGGLFVLDETGNSVLIETTQERFDKANNSRFFATDLDGRIWSAAPYTPGCFDPRDSSFTYLDSIAPSLRKQEYGVLWSIVAYGDSLLYCTTQDAGLVEWDLNTQVGTRITGPSGDKYACLGVLIDADQKIWARTRQGLLHFDPQTKVARWYGKDHGLPVTSATLTRMMADHTGKMWSLGQDWAARIHPEMLRDVAAPPVLIRNIRVNGARIQENVVNPMPTAVELKPGETALDFEFSSLGYNLRSQTRYAYRLLGFEEEWNEALTRRFANYTNLSPGSYVLELKTAVGMGDWGEVRRVQVEVKPFFHQTSWFLLLVLLVIVMLWWSTLRIRKRQIQEKAEIKTEFERKIAEVEMSALRAQMNPHFLFNCLNSIKYFIIQNRVEEAADYLTKFSRLIRLILNNSKTELVPLSAEMDALDLYIQMEQLRFEDQFTYSLNYPQKDGDSAFLPPLLIQPFVENAIWHGLMHRETPGILSVQVEAVDGMLLCTVQDNGVGRHKPAELKSKQSVKRKSLGMDITNDRIETINQLYNTDAHIVVEDLFEQGLPSGTRVTITVPLS